MAIEFNPETQYVVRNNRKYYDVPEEQKPKTDDIMDKYFSGADETKTTNKKYGDNKQNTETTYFDSDGSELGKVCVFSHKNANGEIKEGKSIHITDVNYFDWDNNGTIDCEDTDRVYDRKGNSLKDDYLKLSDEEKKVARELIKDYSETPESQEYKAAIEELESMYEENDEAPDKLEPTTNNKKPGTMEKLEETKKLLDKFEELMNKPVERSFIKLR